MPRIAATALTSTAAALAPAADPLALDLSPPQRQAMIDADLAQVYAVLADAKALSALSGMSGAVGRSAGEDRPFQSRDPRAGAPV